MLHLGVTSLTRWVDRLGHPMSFLLSSSDAPTLSFLHLALTLILSIAYGFRIPHLRSWAEKDLFPATKISSLQKSLQMEKNSRTGIPESLQSSHFGLFPGKISCSIIKSSFRNFSALPRCFTAPEVLQVFLI